MKYEQFYDFVVKVHSVAKIGLKYSSDPYALDNYNQLEVLSREMLENFMNVKFDRPNMFSKDIYPTPNISVRTLIFNGKREILLVREANTNLYSFPGGWADLYDSPKEAAFNEVSQEAGVEPDIIRLIGVLDRRPHKTDKNVPEYVILFEGKVDGKTFHEHTYETNDVGFFPIDKLPEMSRKLSKEEIDRIIDAAINNKVIFD